MITKKGLWMVSFALTAITVIFLELYATKVSHRKASSEDNDSHVHFTLSEAVLQKDNFGENVTWKTNDFTRRNIYWPEELETYMPKGVSSDDVSSFFHNISSSHVVSATQGTISACAKSAPDNKLLVTSGGLKICARYKKASVEGEVLSFYLSQLLQLDSIPPVMMRTYNKTDPFWNNLDIYKWEEGHVVNLNMWIEGLSGSMIRIPQLLIALYHSNKTLTADNSDLQHMPRNALVQLMQISDVLIFGFLQDHTDRFDGNVVKEVTWPNNWNKVPISQTRLRIPPNTYLVNSGEHTNSRKIYLFDNESTFKLDRGGHDPIGQKKNYLNNALMKTVCIFRRKTIERIKYLYESEDLCQVITDMVRDKVFMKGELMRNCSTYINGMLKKRMGEVLRWVNYCSGFKN